MKGPISKNIFKYISENKRKKTAKEIPSTQKYRLFETVLNFSELKTKGVVEILL